MARRKKWVKERYNKLWDSFKDKSFTRDQAVLVLKNFGDDNDTINVILSKLRKEEWLTSKQNKKDARKSIYKLKDLTEELQVQNGKLTRKDIETLLKKAADLIRTRVDYRFILNLLFLKRVSDRWKTEYDQAYKNAIKAGLSEKEAEQEAKQGVYHEFDLPEKFMWDSIRKDVNKLPENLSNSFKALAVKNQELKGVVDRIEFIQFTQSTENFEILRQLMELFSSKSLHDVSPDIIGDAYEWIIRYFAPTKAKEGEVYTPKEVIQLLVEILEPKPNQHIYDPAVGSGGILLGAYQNIKEKLGIKEAEKLFLYGQEASTSIYALCKMNMFIHNIRDAKIDYGDTLDYPKFLYKGSLQKFDLVIANPPWNQDGYDENRLKRSDFWRERYVYGFAPKQSADWVWIQHMLSSTNENGKVGIVIDSGCLSRGAKEKSIKKRILDGTENLKGDLIECVILLPEKLFYNTPSSGAIIIFNKNKPKERKNKVLFINAVKEYERNPDVRRLNILTENNIEKISRAYKGFKNIEGFSRVVSIDEIRNEENDYNLLVPLYVFPKKELEEIDIKKELEEMDKSEKEIKKTDTKMQNLLKLIKTSEKINEIPDSWKKTRLDKISKVQMGQSPQGDTYNKKGIGVPLLNGAADLTENGILINQFTSEPTKIANKGDLLFCIRATIGNINEADQKYCLGRGVAGIKNYETMVDKSFLKYALINKFDYIKRISAGSIIKGIKKNELERLKLLLPKNITEQKNIAEILLIIDKKLELERKRTENLERIKRSLMDDLLTGKKRFKYRGNENV
ncbi:MAG: N-6 DNA methylase [Candidatus Aenigmatarchaeota archaeon]